jgi:hypothetical protein
MIAWLLGLLPAPIKYGLMAAGVVCYLVALIKPESALASWCMVVATLTGATSLFSAAKQTISRAQQLGQSSSAVKLEEPQKVEVTTGTGTQKVDGHSQESADEAYKDIFNP